MMTCCKEKAVLVAIYEEKPRKKRLITRNNDNIKHHYHHHHLHHHHHLQLHQTTKNGKGTNRRAELLSYSKHLRESSKLEASTSSHRLKPLAALITNEYDQQTKDPVVDVQQKEKLKKNSSWVDMNSLFKCFAMSQPQATKRMKKKKKNSGNSSSKKASVIMKTFNVKTQKGPRRFFKRLMATIQKYR